MLTIFISLISLFLTKNKMFFRKKSFIILITLNIIILLISQSIIGLFGLLLILFFNLKKRIFIPSVTIIALTYVALSPNLYQRVNDIIELKIILQIKD